MVLLCGDLTEGVGTCWNARVTSYEDILDKPGPDGGGVPPSSDLTSWIVNGTAVRSSAMPLRELTEGKAALSEAWDQTALRCSGSGAPLEEASLKTYARCGLDQGLLAVPEGVTPGWSTYRPMSALCRLGTGKD